MESRVAASHRGCFHSFVLHRRNGPLGPSVLLRLHGAAVWRTRGQVTSGNALSKLVVGPWFGFFAGWMVDRVGPRRLMLAGIWMAGAAWIGRGSIATL